jgi:hypothetical protein
MPNSFRELMLWNALNRLTQELLLQSMQELELLTWLLAKSWSQMPSQLLLNAPRLKNQPEIAKAILIALTMMLPRDLEMISAAIHGQSQVLAQIPSGAHSPKSGVVIGT